MKKEKSIIALHQAALDRGKKSVFAEIARLGIDVFFELYADELKTYGTSVHPVFQKKQANFNEYLNAIALATDTAVSDMRGLKLVDDHYEFKTFEELKSEESVADELEKMTADELEQIIIEDFKF